MHDEDCYDAPSSAWFQYSTNWDEENGSKSKLILLMTCFTGYCTVVESTRGTWDERMGEV